jgi:hypothetical protein
MEGISLGGIEAGAIFSESEGTLLVVLMLAFGLELFLRLIFGTHFI